jgi:hypothetical protein
MILSLPKGCLLLICMLGVLVGGLCGFMGLEMGATPDGRSSLSIGIQVFVMSLIVGVALLKSGGNDERR